MQNPNIFRSGIFVGLDMRAWLSSRPRPALAATQAVNFLKETNGLLKIEDILPFFPDFVMIDEFKDAICSSLEEYNRQIEDLKVRMPLQERTASPLRATRARIRPPLTPSGSSPCPLTPLPPPPLLIQPLMMPPFAPCRLRWMSRPRLRTSCGRCGAVQSQHAPSLSRGRNGCLQPHTPHYLTCLVILLALQ